NFFGRGPAQAGSRQMRYQAVLASETGERFHFEGFKAIHDDPGFDVWADTTTLFITVRRGESRDGPVVGKGILTIAAADFAREMTTMRVLNAASLTERLGAAPRFGRFFARLLPEVYGGGLARPTPLHPPPPPPPPLPRPAGAACSGPARPRSTSSPRLTASSCACSAIGAGRRGR